MALRNYMGDKSEFIKSMAHDLGFFIKNINRYLVQKQRFAEESEADIMARMASEDSNGTSE